MHKCRLVSSCEIWHASGDTATIKRAAAFLSSACTNVANVANALPVSGEEHSENAFTNRSVANVANEDYVDRLQI